MRCLWSSIYLTALFAAPPPSTVCDVFRHYGRWKIIETNDPILSYYKEPVVVQVHPKGNFHVLGTPHVRVWGSFQLLDQDHGFAVDMAMWNMTILRKRYFILPLDPTHVHLSPELRPTRYYILEKS